MKYGAKSTCIVKQTKDSLTKLKFYISCLSCFTGTYCIVLFFWHNSIYLQVWAILKPGFIALLDDPFDIKLLDIIIFNVLPLSKGNEGSPVYLADQIKERNRLRYTFKVNLFSVQVFTYVV